MDYMLQRFKKVFGDVDVLLVPGDHVAHKVSPHIDRSPTWADWDNVKANLNASAMMIEKYFPDTLVLTNIGNNDGYHSQAVKEEQKEEYYSYLHDLWFMQYPGNAGIADSVKETVMEGGYYRVDVTDSVSVLTLNAEYMDNDDDATYHADEATEQLDWLEA